MRASKSTSARAAAARVMLREIDRIVDGGESRFPDYASFIAADLVTDEKIRLAHARGKAVVVVDEHEHVTVLPAPDPSVGERESERFWRDVLAHW